MGSRDAVATKTPKGWFSRRHQTRESHDEAVMAYAERQNIKRTPPQPPFLPKGVIIK